VTVETTQGTVTVTIDGFEIAVPKGTWIIRAAELLGIAIPRFCDHPLLEPIGACRQCLVEVEGQRKPLASCITACTEGMVVHTQLTSAIADKAQRGVMELLLINHPLDCPMCDKGGECPLQNQAMSNGQGETRFIEEKRTFAKPVPISTQVLLDRERCISCTRCTRTSEEIAGDAFIEFIGRGPAQMIGTAEGKPFNSYFSGNTVQVCPVGALTGAAYRFRSRPFDLMSVPSVCEHCAAGCRQRTDVRRGRVLRRLAGEEPAVNEEWNCDKGRWAFTYATQPDRLSAPLVRDENGMLVPASWPHALAVAADGLLAARDADPAAQPARGVGVLTGGRLTLEDAYGYAKFARMAADTNDIDMRARPHSADEEQFLAACVAGRDIGVSYADLEQAPVVLLAGFEPEDESPIVFLRLRKAVRRHGQQVFSVTALTSPGLVKLSGQLLTARPGEEAVALTALAIVLDAALLLGARPVAVAVSALVVFAFANSLHASGFLAVYLAGLVVGNKQTRAHNSVVVFLDATTWLAQIVMFVLLGLLVSPHRLVSSAVPAVAVALVLMLVARPLAVFLCLAPFRFNWREKLFMAWTGLRGAVAIFLASIPMLVGLSKAYLYFDVAFVVVIISLLLQGWTLAPAARRLHGRWPRERSRRTGCGASACS